MHARAPPRTTTTGRLGGTHLRVVLCVAALLSLFLSIHLSVSGSLVFPYVAAFATSFALICLESRRISTGLVIAAFLLLTATVAFFALPAAQLGCTVADLPFLALCHSPSPDSWYFHRDVDKIATERVPCKVDVLTAILRGE